MSFFEMSLLATLAGSFAVVSIYCYLYLQYRHLYLGLWILSWLLHFTRLPFLSTPLPEISTYCLLAYEIISVISSIIMLVATSMFVGKKLNNAWYLSGVTAVIISAFINMLGLPFILNLIPICLYIGLCYCKSGFLHLYHLDIQGLGKYITGIAYVLLGLHIFDMPFLVTITWFAPWGMLMDGSFRFIIAIGTLIVFLEKTQNDLLKKEQHYRLLTENAIDVIYRYKFSPCGHFDYVSPSIERLIGYKPCDLYQSFKTILRIIHPRDMHIIKKFLRNIPHVPEHSFTLRLINTCNSIVWIEQVSVPLFDSRGIFIGFEAVVRDITSRKSLEDDVSRLDRLKSIGQMAASLAHEIRNPLTTVQGYLQFFAKKQEFSTYNTQIGLLLDELNRTNLILSEYLSLSKTQKPELMPTQLNNIIESLYPLLKVDANTNEKEIFLNLETIPELLLDDKEIRQLILNLVRNGLEAMPQGGTMVISTYPESEFVTLAIQDDGHGIPQYVLDKLGEPFLTTKETGTGLGLVVCYTIAQRHDAKIDVKTSSTGTTFFIRFTLIHAGPKRNSP